jgi:DNA gyrase subunit A
VDDATDEVVGMVCVNVKDKTKTVLVVSANGYGKRTFLDDPETGEANYRITNRGGKGVKTISVTAKTGSLVGLLAVTEAEDLMITCVSGITIRMPVSQISEQGRATQGVKLIKVDEGDEIAAITQLDEKEIEEAIILDEAGNPVLKEITDQKSDAENTTSESEEPAEPLDEK